MDIWRPLAEGQSPRLYRAGQLIYLQGTEAVSFYYLVRGSARSYISSPDGNERVLTVHQAGSIMGEASFFDRCPRVSSAEAQSDCLVYPVNRQQLDAVFQRHPELALPMLQYLSRTVRILSHHVGSASLPAQQRIARYLLDQPMDPDGRLSCTHEEIGQGVGASRVTVSRVLGQLTREGILQTGYGALRILDPRRLRRLAEPLAWE